LKNKSIASYARSEIGSDGAGRCLAFDGVTMREMRRHGHDADMREIRQVNELVRQKGGGRCGSGRHYLLRKPDDAAYIFRTKRPTIIIGIRNIS
jgi:hypothetical protein